MAKKEIDETKKKKSTSTKKETKKKETKKKAPKESYFAGVKSEMSKVKWPTRQEVFKYTMATISFALILILFFILMSLIMSGIKGVFN